MEELIKKLEDKIKNCNNCTSIFNTRDYLLFEDVKEILKNNRGSVLVTPENYYGIEDWVIPHIECPKCKHKLPARDSNYCSGCGVKLKLSTTVQKMVY